MKVYTVTGFNKYTHQQGQFQQRGMSAHAALLRFCEKHRHLLRDGEMEFDAVGNPVVRTKESIWTVQEA